MENRFIELSGEAAHHAVGAYATLTLARHIYLRSQFSERVPWTERLIQPCEQRLGLAPGS